MVRKRNKSITWRLRKCSTPARRAEILHEWLNNWRNEHIELVDWLKDGIDCNDMEAIIRSLGQLRRLTEMKHVGLHNIIDELIYPTKAQKKETND
ncbi:hypothetical protein [Bibersteinia trehalosi]|uniref:hypothetical protein n=1 Tax=Bibersteinia trehalosi TaxID=47735 RepID=UPI00046CF107|nr:hypothetical protein [Bibersteinia trehalosi]